MNTGLDDRLIIYNPDNDPTTCDKDLGIVSSADPCEAENGLIGSSDHNSLSGLQGGLPTERYHINRDEYDAVLGANDPSATNVFATIDDLPLISIPTLQQVVTAGNVADRDIVLRGVAVGAGGNTSPTSSDTAVGALAGTSVRNTNGSGTTSYGYNTNTLLTTGIYNTAIGAFVLSKNTTSSGNTSIGYASLFQLLSSSQGSGLNTAVGYYAGSNTTTGANNTFIGGQAGRNNTTGSNNTYIGEAAGGTIIGNGNVLIGANVGNSLNPNQDLKFILGSSNGSANNYTLITGDFLTGEVDIPGKLTVATAPSNPTDVVRLSDLIPYANKYPLILSPSLDVTNAITIDQGGGLVGLTNILDTYTYESFTFYQLPGFSYTADGVIIILLNGKYYKRSYSGYANLKWWGTKGDGITDDTLAIQTAINLGYPLQAPTGVYRFTTINIPSGTYLIGEGIQRTSFKALPSTAPYAWTISAGPVVNCYFSDFFIQGLDDTDNIGQHGWRIEGRSVPGGEVTGGYWYSTMKKVFISDFDGDQIQLMATATGAQPNQVSYFESCEYHSGTSANSRAMTQQGQVEQIQWTRCAWAGKNPTGTNLAISFEPSPGGSIASGGGAQTFIACYVGSALLGMQMSFSINMKWYGTYFENLQHVCNMTNLTVGILFDGSNFQASGVAPDGNGYAFQAQSGSVYNASRSHYFTRPDYDHLGQGINLGDDNYCYIEWTSKTEGDFQDLEIDSDEALNLAYTFNALNGVTNTTLKTIKSFRGPGKEFLILSNFGFDVVAGGNIYVQYPIRVFRGDYIVVKLIESYWHIVSYVPGQQDSTNISITQFGALGGTNNDTTAFQNAIDYVQSKGGGQVNIPFRADGYSITHLDISPFVRLVGRNFVPINVLPSSATSVITATGIPRFEYTGFNIILNPANVGQTAYNFTYTQLVNVDVNGILNIIYLKDIRAQVSTTPIKTITSIGFEPSDSIRIQADGFGAITDYVLITNQDNIDLPTAYGGQIILRDKDTIQLTKRDFGKEWIVSGLIQGRIELPALPTQGGWLQGEIIYNNVYTPGSNQGWICTTSGNYATTPPVWEKFGNYGDQYTASNGLTRTGNNFALGGVLTQNTSVDTGANILAFGDLTNGKGILNINTDAYIINLETNNLTDALSSGVALNNGNTRIAASNAGNVMSLTFDAVAGTTTYGDALGASGIRYASDYSPNYVTRSLIDKGYADTQYGAKNASNVWTGSNSYGGILLGNSGFNHTIVPEAGMTADYFNQLPAKSGTFAMLDDISAAGMENPMTTKGDIIYGDTSGAPARLGANASGTGFLISQPASEGVLGIPQYYKLFDNVNLWNAQQNFGSAAFSSTAIFSNGMVHLNPVGVMTVSGGLGFSTAFNVTPATVSRLIEFPDKDGTVAMLSDIGTVRLASFTNQVDATTSTSDAYSYTLPGNMMINNGTLLEAQYSGWGATTGTDTYAFNVLFGGQNLFSSGNINNNGFIRLNVNIYRTSSSTVKYEVFVLTGSPITTLVTQGIYQNLSGLDFTTPNILKITFVATATGPIHSFMQGVVKLNP